MLPGRRWHLFEVVPASQEVCYVHERTSRIYRKHAVFNLAGTFEGGLGAVESSLEELVYDSAGGFIKLHTFSL